MSHELIKHAAVRMKNGMIFLGKSHADCFHQAKNVGVPHSQKAKDQGFFTSKGRIVDREEAFKIAVDAGQVSGDRPASILFSEMLWSHTDGGTHKYDSVRGYFL